MAVQVAIKIPIGPATKAGGRGAIGLSASSWGRSWASVTGTDVTVGEVAVVVVVVVREGNVPSAGSSSGRGWAAQVDGTIRTLKTAASRRVDPLRLRADGEHSNPFLHQNDQGITATPTKPSAATERGN